MNVLTEVDGYLADINDALLVLDSCQARLTYSDTRLNKEPCPVDVMMGEMLGCEGIRDIAKAAWRAIKALFGKIFGFIGDILKAIGRVFGLYKDERKKVKSVGVRDFKGETDKLIANTFASLAQHQQTITAVLKPKSDALGKALDEIEASLTKMEGEKVRSDSLDEVMASLVKSNNEEAEDKIKSALSNKVMFTQEDNRGKLEHYLWTAIPDGPVELLAIRVDRDGDKSFVTTRRMTDSEQKRFKSFIDKYTKTSAEAQAKDFEKNASVLDGLIKDIESGNLDKETKKMQSKVDALEKRRYAAIRNMEGKVDNAVLNRVLKTIDSEIRTTGAAMRARANATAMVGKAAVEATTVMKKANKRKK